MDTDLAVTESVVQVPLWIKCLPKSLGCGYLAQVNFKLKGIFLACGAGEWTGKYAQLFPKGYWTLPPHLNWTYSYNLKLSDGQHYHLYRIWWVLNSWFMDLFKVLKSTVPLVLEISRHTHSVTSLLRPPNRLAHFGLNSKIVLVVKLGTWRMWSLHLFLGSNVVSSKLYMFIPNVTLHITRVSTQC